MSFSDFGTSNAPSTIRPTQRQSVTTDISNAISGSGITNVGPDTSDLAENLKTFQVI